MHFEPYKHQVAGHCCIVKLGGRLCKPLIHHEYEFYCILRQEYPQLLPFTAEFFGSVSMKTKKNEREEGECEFIVLEDLTAGMVKPCVMDIKMGTRQRFTTSTSLGFRLCGMRVWRGDGLYAVDRLFGRGLTASSIGSAIEEYLFDGYKLRMELLPCIVNTLLRLLKVMEECPCRLYTSSLLFIYEGREENARVDIRVVDFAHGVPKDTKEGERDDGFVFGLKNLISLFQNISNQYNYQPKDAAIAFLDKSSRCAHFI